MLALRAECSASGLTVYLESGRIFVTPANTCPPALMAKLKAAKSELIEHLRYWQCAEHGCHADVWMYYPDADGNGYCEAHILGSVRVTEADAGSVA